MLDEITQAVLAREEVARYLCGEITHVQAFETHQIMQRLHPDASAADAAVANLRFASGAVGNISNTYMLGAGGGSGLNVVAHDFRLEVSGDHLQWWSPEDSGEATNAVNGYAAEVEAFLQAVETGDRSDLHSDYADAYRTLAVTEAANLSGQRGGEVIEVAGM